MIFVLGTVLVLVAGFFIWRIIADARSYKYKVHLVLGSAHGGSSYDLDAARVIRDPKTNRPSGLKLRKYKFSEEWPTYDFISYDAKGKPHMWATMVNDRLVFLDLASVEPPQLTYRQSGLVGAQRAHQDAERMFSLKNWFEKYGVMIAIMGFAIVIFVIQLINVNQMSHAIDANKAVADQLGRVATQLAQANGAVIPAG